MNLTNKLYSILIRIIHNINLKLLVDIMDKKELINNGKVKSVYTTDDENAVIIEFRDDMTAGDGARKEVMNKKRFL